MKESSSATERVGRYQLLEPIGGGPNGAVWRAKVFGVAGFERQFAIKRFTAELTASASAAQALSAAARSYGSLEHPRIARMSEFGVAQGQTFTAVEMVAGLDAMRLIAESKFGSSGLAIGGALALISQAARAVGYAHGRGLSHLGLSPTNIIVTADGDVKVTDFGILAATLTARPVDMPRLAQRIGYLAPEQLAGETTSAATDVFVLGVIAYELVTGQRAFYGETPHALAQAILAGPPTEPPLPRPIVRVLSRCLARSQFERFPDARAFADALDAALRVAPVPGTRKDIGAQVKTAIDRHAAMSEGMLSGVVALNIESLRPPGDASRDVQEGLATTEFVRPDVPVAGPPPLVGPRDVSPASTLSDLQRPMTTVPGLAPPIPVPPGISTPQPPPIPLPGNILPQTMLGMAAMKKPQMPAVIAQIRPKTSPNGPKPEARGLLGPDRVAGASATRLGGLERVQARPNKGDKDAAETLADVTISDDDLETNLDEDVLEPPDEPKTDPFEVIPAVPVHPPEPRPPTDTSPSIEVIRGEPNTGSGIAVSRTATDTSPPFARDQPTGEMAPAFVRELNRAARLNSDDLPAVAQHAVEQHTRDASPPAATPPRHDVPSIAPTTRGASPIPIAYPSASTPPVRMPSPSPPSLVPPPTPQVTEPNLSPPPPRAQIQPTVSPSYVQASPQASRRPQRWPLILGALVLAGVGIGVFVWQMKEAGDDSDSTVASNDHRKTGSSGASGSGTSGSRTSGSGTSGVVATSGSATSGSRTSGSGTSGVVASGSATSGASGSAMSGSATSGSATSGATSGSATSGSAMSGSATSGSATSGTGTKTHVEPTGSSDSLQITSVPAGARVFIDGADQGVTPVKLSGSGDRHTMALLLAGHELYVAEVDGHGAFSIQLKPVTPPGGPAGVKVIKCKDKDRYYVSIDGKPTGMTCPTERIDCELGAHTVEVYDIVTETRRTFDIKVTDTRLSYRVRVD